MSKLIDRTGEKFSNKYGEYEIIEYNKRTDVTIRFADGTTVGKLDYGHIKAGRVKNPYAPSIYGVGYIGIGKYKATNSVLTYRTWFNMLTRVYSGLPQYGSYEDKTVCKDWHNYQVFAEWFEENYYEVPGEKMEMDKDVLGGDIYSPETVIFIPRKINLLRFNWDYSPTEIPSGFVAKVKTNGKTKYLGVFPSEEEAIDVMYTFKKKHMMDIVKPFKSKIPSKVYSSLLQYIKQF